MRAIENLAKLHTGISKIEYRWFGKVFFILAAIVMLFPFISAPIALLSGIIIANIMGNPFAKETSNATKKLLQISIIGLGFGIHAQSAIHAGSKGFIFTIATIGGTIFIGLLIGKLLRLDRVITTLISVGTAICGGSAIAAVAPVVKSDANRTSIALGTIFILNALALFIFPWLGNVLALTQEQFGIWSAIAIHDTSSVVGAASKYGEEALQTATTVKLFRALFIIPVTLIVSFFYKGNQGKIKIPYFIGLFILAILINSYIPAVTPVTFHLVNVAKAGLTLTLFLIGTTLTFSNLKVVGFKPFLLGIILWFLVSILSLTSVFYFL